MTEREPTSPVNCVVSRQPDKNWSSTHRSTTNAGLQWNMCLLA